MYICIKKQKPISWTSSSELRKKGKQNSAGALQLAMFKLYICRVFRSYFFFKSPGNSPEFFGSRPGIRFPGCSRLLHTNSGPICMETSGKPIPEDSGRNLHFVPIGNIKCPDAQIKLYAGEHIYVHM